MNEELANGATISQTIKNHWRLSIRTEHIHVSFRSIVLVP